MVVRWVCGKEIKVVEIPSIWERVTKLMCEVEKVFPQPSFTCKLTWYAIWWMRWLLPTLFMHDGCIGWSAT